MLYLYFLRCLGFYFRLLVFLQNLSYSPCNCVCSSGLFLAVAAMAYDARVFAKRMRMLDLASEQNTSGLSKLQDLLHSKSLSRSAFIEVYMGLKELEDDPVLDTFTCRRHIDHLDDARFLSIRHVETLPRLDGSFFRWELCQPALLLDMVLRESEELQAAFLSAFEKHGCSAASPWHLVIGFDEFVPGDKLKVNNHKKAMALSFSFSQLGPEILAHDVAWMTPVVLRHTEIAIIRGGWSHAMKRFLHILLYGTHGFESMGLPIQIRGVIEFVLFAVIGIILADGDGLRLLDWKGASSLRPCPRHANVVKKDSDLSRRICNFREITCCEYDDFIVYEDGELEDNMDVLLLAKHEADTAIRPDGSKRRFDEIDLAFGLTANAHGVLACPTLRRSFRFNRVIRMDWVHSALQNGMFPVAAWECLQHFKITAQRVEAFLKDERWKFPTCTRFKGKQLHRIFNEYRSTSSDDADKLKAGAGEAYGLYMLLLVFFELNVTRDASTADALDVLTSACAVIQILALAKKGLIGMRAASRKMREQLKRHMTLFIRVFGTKKIIPKHHWLFDVTQPPPRFFFPCTPPSSLGHCTHLSQCRRTAIPGPVSFRLLRHRASASACQIAGALDQKSSNLRALSAWWSDQPSYCKREVKINFQWLARNYRCMPRYSFCLRGRRTRDARGGHSRWRLGNEGRCCRGGANLRQGGQLFLRHCQGSGAFGKRYASLQRVAIRVV